MTDSKSPKNTPSKASTKKPAVKTQVLTDKASAAKQQAAHKQQLKAKGAPVESKKAPAAKAAPVVSKAKEPGNSGGSGIAILFSLAALAGTGFTWYQTQVEQVRSESGLAVGVTEIGGQVSRISDTVSRLQKQQADVVSQQQLNAGFSELSTSLDKKVSQISEQQSSVNQLVDKLGSDLQKGSNAYVLEEASQLLRLANNAVLFSANPDSAVKALSLADAQLKGLNDPRYTAVRTKINQEITALKSVQQVDVASLSATLNAISSSVPSLPLANEPEAEVVKFNTEDQKQDRSWRTELSVLWQEVKNSIQVQRVDQPPKPLLVPQQRYFLNQNLQLALSKAELALLQNRSTVFAQSIDSATQWLNDYFDVSDQRVSSVLTQLSQTKQQKLDVKLPPITGSYQALQEIRGGQ